MLAAAKPDHTPRKGTGPPIKNVKIRINPGDYNIKFANGVTATDTVAMLKQLIYEETLNEAKAKTALSENSSFNNEDPTADTHATNISSNNRQIPLCPVEDQRIMFLGRELRNNEVC